MLFFDVNAEYDEMTQSARKKRKKKKKPPGEMILVLILLPGSNSGLAAYPQVRS